MFAGEQIRRGESFRLNLHRSEIGDIENCYVDPRRDAPSGHEPGYQLVLPYHGMFSYFAGSRGWQIDATRTLCISPGWDFHEERSESGSGHAAILINPSFEIVEELCGARCTERNPAFIHASVPSSRRLQILTHRLVRDDATQDGTLRKDELIVSALGALQTPRGNQRRASSLVRRAKDILHAHSGDRLSLTQMAAMVGVTPVYLTQEFKRAEGLPLYRYQMELRLSRALLELPNCNDITALALELGFSSHSHFTAVFRRAFDMTPSRYRSGNFGSDLPRIGMKRPATARSHDPLARAA